MSDVSFSHNTQRQRQTERQTDDAIMPVADHTTRSSQRLMWKKMSARLNLS